MTPKELKAAREKLALTQQKFAELLGVTRDAIARWESGRQAIDRRTQLAVEHLTICKRRKK